MKKNKEADDFRLIIKNQDFRRIISIAEDSSPDSFSEVLFINCSFDQVDLSEFVFWSCDFQNCLLKGFRSQKTIFLDCCFEDSKIMDSQMMGIDCQYSQVKGCTFINVNLLYSGISSCEVTETKFLKSNLSLILIDFSRIENCIILDCDIQEPLFNGAYIKNVRCRLSD